METELAVYDKLSEEERERRLIRSGLEADLTGGKRDGAVRGKYSQTKVRVPNMRPERQAYNVCVFGLSAFSLAEQGAGKGMRAVRRPFAAAETGLVAPDISAEWDEVWADSAGTQIPSRMTLSRAGERAGRRAEVEDAEAGTGGGAGAYLPDALPRLRSSRTPESRIFRRLERLAVKTLYTLGLEAGEVTLTSLGDRQFAVTGVRPIRRDASGELPEPCRTAERMLREQRRSELPGRPGLLMGMDPEFVLFDAEAQRVVPASRFFPADGIAGCDGGPPGTRGLFPVAELRPPPRAEPRALLAQLMSALRAADNGVSDRSLSWRSGGMPLRGWSLGGHLHFSGVTLTAPLLRALDNYLALPVALLEDERARARRPRYGSLGDFRLQPHGGFEYRTLPSFLVSPAVARGAVALAHLIVSRYEELTHRPLDDEPVHAAFYGGGREPLRAAFPALAAQLRALDGYAPLARYIDPLFAHIEAGRTWDETRDIRTAWGLVN
ncbi:hypothetical protein ACE6ED_00180 [Paenibacillus sp. CN-4]|uniref:putative amidoligase domain-containing protein n=1 Tax=Paenibacillus nanchangensis TaxID=3348343 RepID=UPI00397DE390